MNLKTVRLSLKDVIEGKEDIDIDLLISQMQELITREDLISDEPHEIEKGLMVISKILQILDGYKEKSWQKAYICYFYNKVFPEIGIYDFIASSFPSKDLKEMMIILETLLDNLDVEDKNNFFSCVNKLKEKTWDDCDIVDGSEEIKIFLETVEHEGREWELLVVGPSERIADLKKKLVKALQ